jgi:HK97 family phage major capsid protein
MNVTELRAQLSEKNTQVKGLAEKPILTPEEAKQWDALLTDMDGIKANIERLNQSAKVDAYLNEPAGTKAAHLAQSVQVVKDEADQGFAHAGEFFMAVKNAALYPGREDVRLRSLKAPSGMSEGVPADGGYLVQTQYSAGIVERMYNIGQVLGRVSQDSVQSNNMTYFGVDETSRVVGSRWGGVRGYWLAEGGTITSSKGKFRLIDLKLKKVGALVYATDEQLSDTPLLSSWLGRVVPDELRFQVEDAIYEGDGVGKPLGIMNSPCLVSVTRIDANEIDATDIANMWSRRWAGVSDYVWLINQAITPQLNNLTVGNWPVFIPAGGYSATPYASIYGKPVIEVEYASALGTTGDIMLASLSQYQTITNGGIQAASSMHVLFTTDEMAFRFIYRVDGAPLWHSALTPFKGSATQSPFVVLSSASA